MDQERTLRNLQSKEEHMARVSRSTRHTRQEYSLQAVLGTFFFRENDEMPQ